MSNTIDAREAALADVLAAREKRVACQRDLLARFGKPVVCLTLNIAGPVKVNAETAYAFRVGANRLTEGLKTMEFPVLAEETLASVAGKEWLAAVDAPAPALKRLCVSLEELDELGRLFDMDVIAPDGWKLERGAERRCLVCGLPGRGCASRRVHPVAEIQAVTWRIIREHRLRNSAKRMAQLTVQSLLDEVCVTPKPGLVDRADNGSHRDMDIFTFNASAAALWPYFEACYLAGARDAALPEADAFRRLQTLGIDAERRMRAATRDVNTHKGAIFTLGILCGAAGRIGTAEPDAWLRACAALAGSYRAEGVRAEAADGLPSVRNIGLPALRRAKESGLSLNDQGLSVLLALLAGVRDTNMIARGGAEAAEEVRRQAEQLLEARSRGEETRSLRDLMDEMNRAYIARNLSPGGCADLLAATLLVDRASQTPELMGL